MNEMNINPSNQVDSSNHLNRGTFEKTLELELKQQSIVKTFTLDKLAISSIPMQRKSFTQ